MKDTISQTIIYDTIYKKTEIIDTIYTKVNIHYTDTINISPDINKYMRN